MTKERCMRKMIQFVALVTLTACSSIPKTGLDHVGEEQVLSRIDDLSSRPEWLIEETPFKIEGGRVSSIGQTSIPIGDNLSAAYRIAENNAKASVSSAITQKLTYLFQNAEEGTLGANQARYIGEETSRLSTSYIHLAHRYWEKVRMVGENGEATVQYRVFVAVEMPEERFKASVIDALREIQGRPGISAEFAAKVDREWDKMSESDTKVMAKREPASIEAKTVQNNQ
jgi:hypothetical protein